MDFSGRELYDTVSDGQLTVVFVTRQYSLRRGHSTRLVIPLESTHFRNEPKTHQMVLMNSFVRVGMGWPSMDVRRSACEKGGLSPRSSVRSRSVKC